MPLPNFVIVGERKSGTTALCHWMAHPDVYMHPREDMNYFIEDESSHVMQQVPQSIAYLKSLKE